MPLELANPLSHERELEKDSCIRIEAAEALYLIALQVCPHNLRVLFYLQLKKLLIP